MTQRWAHKIGHSLSPRLIGAVYVWAILVVIFSILRPSTFPNTGTIQLILNQNAVTGLVALGLLLPLAAGLYDLSVGSVVGLSGIMSAWFLANVSSNIWLAILVGLATALAVGLANCFTVLVMGVNSFIGTLATSSIVSAIAIAVSGDNTITKNVVGPFQNLALANWGGITTPVFLMVATMLVLGYVMERIPFGRYIYAIGFNQEVARLGGLRIFRSSAIALLASAFLAGLGGVAETATLGAGSDTIGPSYLLPAFAAAFLGATQFRRGRFNPWGTMVAVLLLGTAEVGLLVVGAPAWSPDIFSGAMLIAAVSLTAGGGGVAPLRNLSRLWRERWAAIKNDGPAIAASAPQQADEVAADRIGAARSDQAE
jgi:ribose transport system permease protein